jgi:hypothetical protein
VTVVDWLDQHHRIVEHFLDARHVRAREGRDENLLELRGVKDVQRLGHLAVS